MSSTGINTLTTGTINGLNSLALDDLSTTTISAGTIDGDIIYYNRIEGNEIIVDTKLTLTNTGVISVGDKTITDIELTYLDGVSSNIQTQINHINTNNSELILTVNSHTSQITALQTSDTAQNTAITNLQTSDTSQNTAITDLQLKTSNITSANATATSMNRALRITTNGECLRTIGNHTFWSGFDAANTTRHFAIGKEGATSNRLMFSNYTLGETVIQSGSRSGNTNLGQNKIITNSNGISLRRGGITSGDTEVIAGEIGATGADNHLRINGNGTNNIYINSGLGSTDLVSNLLWIGSGTANANGRKSNINMLDSTGNNWETQSSAFTETLKSQIGTNSSNITILQTSNASLNTSITALQTSDTSQTNQIILIQEDMLDLQNTESAQSAQLAALQISDTAQNTKITALETKTQNITSANTTSTNMNKPIYMSSNEGLRMYGGHGFISSFPVSGLRDYYIGTPSTNNKKLTLQNEKAEGIYLQTGSRTGNANTANSNLGQNKVVIHGLGISLKRGGITLNDEEITVGEIGALDPLNRNLYITGNSTNDIHINSGIGATVLNTNMVWMGSGTSNANGRKTNIKMLDATGTWEIQSSAFTEELKAKVLGSSNPKSFNNGTGKIEFIAASFWWLGFAYNLTTLIASRLYDFAGEGFYYGAEMSVGSWLNPFGYASMFDATGAYLLNDKPNLTLIFEMDFTAAFSSVNYIISKVVVKNNAGTVLTETLDQGTYYNGAPQANARHYKYLYTTAPLRHILNQGDRIFVNTRYIFTTPNSASINGVAMKGKFSIHAN